jgi:DNA-binding NtrC family response regulator
MSQESILVVDDEEVMRDVLGSLLTQAGYEVSLAENGAEGLELARKGTHAAALVDMMLPEMDGMTVLEELKKTDPELVVLMITAHASVETAIAAMRRGAFDYVAKPFKHEELLHALANGLNQRRLTDENRQPRPRGRPSSWPARAAPGRSWWPRPSTPTRPGRTSPSSS